MIAEEWDVERIKNYVAKLERWFIRNGGDEQFVSTDPYLNDLKDGLKLCRRFKSLIAQDETDFDELNAIYAGLERDCAGHGWIELRVMVILWKDHIHPQLKSDRNV